MSDDTIPILFIDDDAGYASIIKHLLSPFQGKKFDVAWESDGDKALQLLRGQHNFRLVLMDYYLPNMNGLEIIQQMYDEGITLPIIILTANRDFRTAVEAMKFGVEDYLLKEEASDTILPRTILNALDRVALKQRLAGAEKRMMFSRTRNEAIKELIVTMCHEFNNPLAAIKISASIMGRQQQSEEQRSLLDNLNKNIIALEQRINKLRDLNLEQ